MIYLMLSISVCTLVMVVFISIDVLRNRSVVDKTREDINNMVKIDDCWVSVTRKVPKKLIARD